MILDIKLGFQIILGHPKCHFPAIYRFSGQYRQLWRKSIFWSEKYQKSTCAHFVIFYDMKPYFAACGPKSEICFEICSPGPKDTSEYLGCKRLMSRWYFFKHQKITIFDNFHQNGQIHVKLMKKRIFEISIKSNSGNE